MHVFFIALSPFFSYCLTSSLLSKFFITSDKLVKAEQGPACIEMFFPTVGGLLMLSLF